MTDSSGNLTVQDVNDAIEYHLCSPLVADSRTIALIAAKKNFNHEKERMLIEKAKVTKCMCHHYTNTSPCYYRNCRHFPQEHYGSQGE